MCVPCTCDCSTLCVCVGGLGSPGARVTATLSLPAQVLRRIVSTADCLSSPCFFLWVDKGSLYVSAAIVNSIWRMFFRSGCGDACLQCQFPRDQGKRRVVSSGPAWANYIVRPCLTKPPLGYSSVVEHLPVCARIWLLSPNTGKKRKSSLAHWW